MIRNQNSSVDTSVLAAPVHCSTALVLVSVQAQTSALSEKNERFPQRSFVHLVHTHVRLTKPET